jgi:hypothetical protein
MGDPNTRCCVFGDIMVLGEIMVFEIVWADGGLFFGSTLSLGLRTRGGDFPDLPLLVGEGLSTVPGRSD